MPTEVLERYWQERAKLLRDHQIDVNTDWHAALGKLPLESRHLVQWELLERYDAGLDQGHGVCLLRNPGAAKIVADSLLHADETKYVVTDFVIMPNHVHLLASFPTEDALVKQCESWKRYTATRINRLFHQRGEYWQVESFDHLVRSPEYLRGIESTLR